MTPEEFEKTMRRISKEPDVEKRHQEADELIGEILQEKGYEAGMDIFWSMEKWYS